MEPLVCEFQEEGALHMSSMRAIKGESNASPREPTLGLSRSERAGRGRKWQAEEEVEEAESCPRQKVLVGTMATRRAGLGYFPRTQVGKAQRKKRDPIQKDVQAGVDEEWVTRTVGLRQQRWTR